MKIRKKFRVEMAHRVLHSYTERCQGIHGHSYIIEVILKGYTQDKAEMLLDFKLLKERLYSFIDKFDHSLVTWDKDQEILEVIHKLNKRYIITPYNPTAEQMSRHIYKYGEKIGLSMSEVIIHETETGYASFSGCDGIDFNLEEVIYSVELQD